MLICDTGEMADALNRRLLAATTPHPAARHTHADGIDQVRNGNRWRVTSVGPTANRFAAQGVTTDTAHAVTADSSTRSMTYVAMSRGRDTNHAYLCTRDDVESDHARRDRVTDGGSINCSAAPNIQQRITFAAAPPTTTGPAPSTTMASSCKSFTPRLTAPGPGSRELFGPLSTVRDSPCVKYSLRTETAR